MKLKRIIHPNFTIGLVSYLALFAGILMNASDIELGKAVIVGSILLGGIHWFRSIVDVSRDKMRREDAGVWYFWFASVLIIPPLRCYR